MIKESNLQENITITNIYASKCGHMIYSSQWVANGSNKSYSQAVLLIVGVRVSRHLTFLCAIQAIEVQDSGCSIILGLEGYSRIWQLWYFLLLFVWIEQLTSQSCNFLSSFPVISYCKIGILMFDMYLKLSALQCIL